MNKFIIGWLLLLSSVSFADDQIESSDDSLRYFTPANILKFADYLYDNGEFTRAAGEYQRYLITTSKSSGSDSIYYRMTKALFLGKDYSRCDKLLDSFGDYYSNSSFQADIPLFRSILEFRRENYVRSLQLAEDPGISSLRLKNIIVVSDYLYLGQYAQAKKYACDMTGSDILSNPDTTIEYSKTMAHLCEKSRSAAAMKFKSRFRAGLYSSIIPGAGKIYCGRVADGIYSFIIIGLFGWQSYEGFSDHGRNSANGWFFGIAGTGFYFSNIYGSTVAAKMYNQKRHADFLNGLQIEITLP